MPNCCRKPPRHGPSAGVQPELRTGHGHQPDWWKIRIDNVIAAESVTSILNQCYILGNANACDRVTRDPENGSQVTDVTRTLINGGYQETAGYDLGIKYRLPEFSFGNIIIDWKTTYVDYRSTSATTKSRLPSSSTPAGALATGVATSACVRT